MLSAIFGRPFVRVSAKVAFGVSVVVVATAVGVSVPEPVKLFV
jgi:hypothetical protein